MIEQESPSKASSNSDSIASLSHMYLANTMHKSAEWLSELREIHYVPYNSCNSLTIYSYKSWSSQNKFLVATKANNLKEFYFKSVMSANEDLSLENSDIVFSNRSSVSSNNSSQIAGNTTSAEEKSNSLQNSNELMYLEPVVNIHQFSRIKSEGLISSIDVFEIQNFSVFIVTYTLKPKPVEHYFVQIYCDFETSNLELILECCQEFELSSMPHKISHLDCIKYGDPLSPIDSQTRETLIMVNCSKRINVFFTIDIVNRKFKKIEKISDYFIEFDSSNIPDNCVSHDIKYFDSSRTVSKGSFENRPFNGYVDRRLTAIGGQHGWLGVFLCDTVGNQILKYWDYENDSFITQLNFFTTKSINEWSRIDTEKTPINLLMLRSLEPTRIFNNVLKYDTNHDDFQDIEIPNNCDLVTSAIIYDATFSGYNTIILSTFGKVILFYSPMPLSSFDGAIKKSPFKHQRFIYEKKREFSFKHSVMGLANTLLTKNGAFDLVILTLNGLSIWQYCPERLTELVNQRFEENEQIFIDMINSKVTPYKGK